MIHTNRCKNCNKTKEEHISATGYSPLFCNKDSDSLKTFTDSGLAAVDAHKEELYEAVRIAFELPMTAYRDDREMLNISIPIMRANKIFSILNQIEKEK